MRPPSPTLTNTSFFPQINFKVGDLCEITEGEYEDSILVIRKLELSTIVLEFVEPNQNAENDGYEKGESYCINVDQAVKTLQVILPPQKVEYNSVVIPDHKRLEIDEALEQINQQNLIFRTWNFAKTIEKGRGINMLFHGEPGTGKTLMAQAIATKLDFKLKIIATADIQSSAPGQSERAIRQAFKDATKEKKTILLFDECDSLLYDRTNTGAILGAQINELLTQLERFKGVTIFTTNRLGVLDEAINRRLALKIEFEMPSPEERLLIWKRMIPDEAPLADNIDFQRLANVSLTGGYIKNAVLRAARMAAIQDIPDKKKKITMDHLIKALSQETQSMLAFKKAKADQEKKGVHH